MFRKLPLLYKIAAAVPVVGVGVLCYRQLYNRPQLVQVNQQSVSPIIAQSNVQTIQMQNSIQKQTKAELIAQKQQISTIVQIKADSTSQNTIQQRAAQTSNNLENKSQQKQQTKSNQTQKQTQISKKQSEQQSSLQNKQTEGRNQQNSQLVNQQNSQPSKQQTSSQQQQVKKQAVKKIKINKFSQIPLIDKFDGLQKEPYLMIVLDPGYTSMFQNQLMTKITKTINKRSNTTPLAIYRINSKNKEALAAFQKQFQAKIRQQDIYLLKNPYDSKFINVDFDLFLKHDRIPSIYLSQLKCALNDQQLKSYITKMTPNDTYLLFTVDSAIPADLDKRKLVAKYIQLELGAHSYENIKLCLTDHKSAQEAGIISPQAKPNSLHLIRKGNQFTYKPPNRWIYENKPYHVIESINLQDKEQNILLPRYLSKIQTFTSLKLDSPYICLLNIDRNRINPKQEREILKVIGQLKASKKYPMVSFVLRFGQTQFRGTKEDPFSNKKWCLKLAHASQMDKQQRMLQVKNEEQRKYVGIDKKDWLRSSNQYLFKEPQITEEGVSKFFDRVLQGGEPQHYKSQAKFKLGLVDKVTGQTFNQIIFGQSETKKSHLVFEYSDHCQACQALSPIIDYFADVCSKFPQLGVNVHALNCDKSKVKGQPYSPYTPNLYYYSKNWKNRSPIRYPILEYIKHTNIWGIYDFCMITDQLTKIDINKFEDHIKQIMNSKVKIQDF